MKLSVFSLILTTIALAVAVTWRVSTQPNTNLIVDVSWPNCRLTLSNNYDWGIVGVTGGLDFRPNPCLAEESTWFRHISVYINTGYPGNSYAQKYRDYPKKCDSQNNLCLAYNYGYNASLYAVNYANKQQVHSHIWWLDVETDNSWSSNVLINQTSLTGAIAALNQHLFYPKIGIYSNSVQWSLITGNWDNNLPVWVATGDTNPGSAASACNKLSFSGASSWLSQYTQGIDIDYACSLNYKLALDQELR